MKSDTQESQIDFVACPTSQESQSEDSLNQVGPYNPLHLAGQALSLGRISLTGLHASLRVEP